MSRTMELLEQLGLDLELVEGDLITDAVIVARISREDGSTYVGIDVSDGTDVIVERGLVEFALEVHRNQTWGTES